MKKPENATKTTNKLKQIQVTPPILIQVGSVPVMLSLDQTEMELAVQIKSSEA